MFRQNALQHLTLLFLPIFSLLLNQTRSGFNRIQDVFLAKASGSKKQIHRASLVAYHCGIRFLSKKNSAIPGTPSLTTANLLTH